MINLDDRLIREDLKRLKPNGFAVLMAITIHLDAKKCAFPGIKRLSELTGIGRDAVYNAIETLIEVGYVRRSQQNDNGVFGKTIYTVTTRYLQIYINAEGIEMESDEPLPEKPYTEITASGDSVIEVLSNDGSIKQKEVKPKTKVLRNPLFETFWKAYGNKVAKQRACTAFVRLSKAEQQQAIDGLKAYDEYRSRPENSYLEQMHPTTYLNGKRWNDEYPPPKNEPINLADQPIDPSTAEKYQEAKEKLYTSYPALKEVPFFKHSEFVNFVNLSSEYLGANWKTRATERQIKEKHCELLAKLNNTPYLRKTCPGIYPYLQTEMKKILYHQ